MRAFDHSGRSVTALTGLRSWAAGDLWERVRFAALVLFLFLCLIGGGSSRPETMSLLYVRAAAVLCCGLFLLTPAHRDWRSVRWPLILWMAAFAVIAIQLIPLPPTIWSALPGHAHLLEGAVAAGLPQPWRPVSMTPDFTRSCLLWLLPPLVVIIGFASLGDQNRSALAPILIAGACISALVGVLQLTGGSGSPLYNYRFSHRGFPVGLLANRNHEAVLLALTIPLLSAWALHHVLDRRRVLLAAGMGVLMIPSILITGSRAGLAIGMLGVIAGTWLAYGQLKRVSSGRWRLAIGTAIVAIPLVLGSVAFMVSRAVSIDRLVGQDLSETELRVRNMPLLIDLVGEFFPFGSGFGSFDTVFRMFESDASLDPYYFNRAHNDLLEVAITGGLPGLIVLGALFAWWARASWRVLTDRRSGPSPVPFGKAAAIAMLMLLLASLVDYPIGTPLLAAVFTVLACWLQEADNAVKISTTATKSPGSELRTNNRPRSRRIDGLPG